MIDSVRLSQQARDQLVTLKRYTGIKQWNTLCRWAFCISLAEPTPPPKTKIVTDSSVEMTWKVFGGTYQELYLGLIKQRCEEDGLGSDPEVVAHQFRLHLHRGIGYLAGEKNLRTISALVSKAVDARVARPATSLQGPPS